MAILCEIDVFKPSDGVFTPGSTVSGIVKYSLDDNSVFSRTTISLKGIGSLLIDGSPNTSCKTEIYVDIDNIIHDSEKIQTKGSHELEFCFKLPYGIPSSLKYKRNTIIRTKISCRIVYYIRIKFERGLMKFQKKFKEKLTVVSGITPKLPMIPVICGEQKRIRKIFASKNNTVYIKAIINKCVFKPGEKIELDLEVINDSGMRIKEVEIKLVEVHYFETDSNKKYIRKALTDTGSKNVSVGNGASRNMSEELTLPMGICCLEDSKIVSRYYVVNVVAKLPIPHRNAVLDIQIQVGDTNTPNSMSSDA